MSLVWRATSVRTIAAADPAAAIRSIVYAGIRTGIDLKPWMKFE
jgi:hypothetical protein